MTTPVPEGGLAGRIRNAGRLVPVVAFYSVQGGVGKSTLARKFAELVTLAPGRPEHRPNVLLVDLDVDAKGITVRIADNVRRSYRTVHDAVLADDPSVAQTISVTGAVSLVSVRHATANLPGSGEKGRGQLYLVPAAPSGAPELYDVPARVDKKRLAELLLGMLQLMVKQHDIDCVVIDCGPGVDPYSAAAAAIADFPLLIGRNELASFQQIWELPERFREWYPDFQPARQRVIINMVAVQDTFKKHSNQYSVLDYVPLVSDVIHETEGLPEERRKIFSALLFEKYVVEIIEKVLFGQHHLIPAAPDVLGEEWVDTLHRLERVEQAPVIQRLRILRNLLWVGAILAVLGVALIAARQVFHGLPAWLTTIGILGVVAGLVLAGAGWYADSRRRRLLTAARGVVVGGPEGIFDKLELGPSHRKELDELEKLADSIPKESDPSSGLSIPHATGPR